MCNNTPSTGSAPRKKIGFLAYSEPWIIDLMTHLKELNCNLDFEFISVAETTPESFKDYAIIIDRLSYTEGYLQSLLCGYSLRGTYVINNPFTYACDDKFVGLKVAEQLNIRVPYTLFLPPKTLSYDYKDVVKTIDIEKLSEKIRFPAIMKPVYGWGWQDVFYINNLEELKQKYTLFENEPVLLQEFIPYQHYVRAFVIGKSRILPIKYDPQNRAYIYDVCHLSRELGEIILNASEKLCRALDYDINTIEFAIKENEVFAIDFFNTVPEIKRENLPEEYYWWIVKNCAEFICELLRENRKNRQILI